jgi:hypothetical protein
MSHTITISDSLYTRLQKAMRARGADNLETLLADLTNGNDETTTRRAAVQQINELRERLFAKYGPLPDSAELLREDRAR